MQQTDRKRRENNTRKQTTEEKRRHNTLANRRLYLAIHRSSSEEKTERCHTHTIYTHTHTQHWTTTSHKTPDFMHYYFCCYAFMNECFTNVAHASLLCIVHVVQEINVRLAMSYTINSQLPVFSVG